MSAEQEPMNASEGMRALIDKFKTMPRRTPEEMAAWEWKNSIIPKLRSVGLPARFHHERTEWKCAPQEKVFRYCERAFTGRGAIVVLCGVRGAGKTEIASQLIVRRARACMEKPEGWPVPYTKLTDLLVMFKPLYADFGSIGTEALTRRREQFCGYGLRIIDELHDCDEQRLKGRVLTDIIDRCYSRLTDTLLISNETEQEFRATAGDSVVSRISEHGRIIECTWPSFRTK